MKLFSCAVGLAIILSGCSAADLPVTGVDQYESRQDSAPLLADAGDVVPEGAPDWGNPDIPSDLFPACQPGTGCFGEPCADAKDCLSGLCVGHLGDSVCTQECVEECPEGWLCQQTGAGGPDVMFICISPYTHLCRPCASNDDCVSETGVEDACLDFGPEGRFCGADCSATGQCPAGYVCGDAANIDGVVLTQCVPEQGICDCSQNSVKLGLTTPCYVDNEWGTCHGIRFCGAEGLSTCDAVQPAEETCNGQDDDCDGQVDNLSCDDDDACTTDQCDPEAGQCVHDPLTGTECADGDVCTLADHCQEGACVGTPITCSDDNPCTDDSCNPTGGCLFTPNADKCDDQDPCTVDDTCQAAACAGFSIPCDCTTDEDCLALEDGDICNGTLYCDLTSFPPRCAVDQDTVISCEEPQGIGAECLSPECDPETGECSFQPANEAALCDPGDACLVGARCNQGTCAGAMALNCNDANPCTTDSCDPAAGCLFQDNDDPCSDNDVCTQADVCADGECVPGALLECDDGNPCTGDSCNTLTGCQHVHLDLACDDGDNCTIDDWCIAGQCTAAVNVSCDDMNPCTTDWCESGSGCHHENNTAPCADLDLCSAPDVCAGGTCQGGTPVNCNDGKQCTADSCLPDTGCIHETVAGTCSDGNACTQGDTCVAGTCEPGTATDCGDNNPCTDDSCDPQQGCAHFANTEQCDDANECTSQDHCQDGQCVAGDIQDCDDKNPCTQDKCSALLGCVHTALDGAPCFDGTTCTTPGKCAGSFCQSGPQLDCDDENPCTTDSCDPATGCLHEVNEEPCNDHNACTVADACSLGECIPGAELSCDDANVCTDDTCSPDLGCLHTNNTGPCDDQNTCTTQDKCQDGQCVGKGALTCEDNNPCTKDICLPNGGCMFQVIEIACSDGDACTVGDMCIQGVCTPGPALNCDDGNVCTADACEPDGMCVHAPNQAPCDDANACTTGDHCSGGACVVEGMKNCDDENPCTNDSCDMMAGCQYVFNTAPCDDSDACTVGETCDNGACAGGIELNCNDGNPCTDDACAPDSGCVLTNNNAACSDGNVCTLGDQCSQGACTAGPALDCDDATACTTDACDPQKGCTHATLDCDDSNACTTDSCLSGAGCQHAPVAGVCDDGDPCTNGDTCVGGVCTPGPYSCAESNCTNSVDDDNDGYTDCNDPDCAGGSTCIILEINQGGIGSCGFTKKWRGQDISFTGAAKITAVAYKGTSNYEEIRLMTSTSSLSTLAADTSLENNGGWKLGRFSGPTSVAGGTEYTIWFRLSNPSFCSSGCNVKSVNSSWGGHHTDSDPAGQSGGGYPYWNYEYGTNCRVYGTKN